MPVFKRNKTTIYGLAIARSGGSVDKKLVESICSKNKLDPDEIYAILNEATIAGDCGGNPEDVSSGISSGDITNQGPEIFGSKPKKRKKEHEDPKTRHVSTTN